jgi:hypothetical protein
MNRNALIAALAVGAVIGAAAVKTITIGDTLAAPFNARRDTLADAGIVTAFCVNRVETPRPDGGTFVSAVFSGTMVVPEVRTLPDGGTRTVFSTLNSEPCDLVGANLTAAVNFANGPVAACIRASNDLEQ